FWILGVFLSVFFLLPTRLFPKRPNLPKLMRIAGNWARTVLGVTTLVFFLSSLRVFGAITVVLLFLGAIAVSWFRKSAGMPGRLKNQLTAIDRKSTRLNSSHLGISYAVFCLKKKKKKKKNIYHI